MALKRVLRYLRGMPRAHYLFRWQKWTPTVRCQVDSDWAGCLKTRRSTSGGVLYRGGHCLAQWSRTQQTVALSSAEAELNAALKGAVELLGLKEMVEEMGTDLGATLEGDSSACKGILSRQGSGRVKHLEVRQLWVQQHIRDNRLQFEKVPRHLNTADSQAKHWTNEGPTHFSRMGFVRPGL